MDSTRVDLHRQQFEAAVGVVRHIHARHHSSGHRYVVAARGIAYRANAMRANIRTFPTSQFMLFHMRVPNVRRTDDNDRILEILHRWLANKTKWERETEEKRERTENECVRCAKRTGMPPKLSGTTLFQNSGSSTVRSAKSATKVKYLCSSSQF